MAQLLTILRERFCPPEWAMLTEVPNGIGRYAERRVDAIAMNLYPSRGHEIHGFELKVSKSDYQRELKDPDKAESLAQHCHRWWIVAPDGVVDLSTLPTNWGLLVARNDKLRVARQPERLDATAPTYKFLAGMLRRATEKTVDAEALQAEFDRGIEAGKWLADPAMSGIQREVAGLKKMVETFREKSGVDLETWNAGNIGQAVKDALDMQKMLDRIGRVLKTEKHFVERLAELADRYATTE